MERICTAVLGNVNGGTVYRNWFPPQVLILASTKMRRQMIHDNGGGKYRSLSCFSRPSCCRKLSLSRSSETILCIFISGCKLASWLCKRLLKTVELFFSVGALLEDISFFHNEECSVAWCICTTDNTSLPPPAGWNDDVHLLSTVLQVINSCTCGSWAHMSSLRYKQNISSCLQNFCYKKCVFLKENNFWRFVNKLFFFPENQTLDIKLILTVFENKYLWTFF